ncbi:MAG: hypothetical protein ACE5R6_10620 [Candidatus Heimdallarchaeota archaeon]
MEQFFNPSKIEGAENGARSLVGLGSPFRPPWVAPEGATLPQLTRSLKRGEELS